MSLNLDHLHRVHCVGIGGIGVSAVAKLLRLMGKEVGGSDAARTVVTADVEKMGIPVRTEDAASVSPDLDLLIYTPAAPETHPERQAAAALGIPQFSYPEFLGLLSRAYDTVAVCGTNGKSTTTAMLGLMLEAAGLDPLVIVGSRVPGFPYGNLRPQVKPTTSDAKGLLVLEACEYRGAFLHLAPKHVVVTNVTHDHPDYFRDLEHTREVFQRFVDGMAEGGALIVNADDPVAGSGLKPKGPRRTFGFGPSDVRALDMRFEPGVTRFTVAEREGGRAAAELRVPGAFNVANALGAAAAARLLGAPPEAVTATLEKFNGIWRRFERIGETSEGSLVISDYGHHPDAVRATLAAAREFYPGRRIVLCYQPHHHERTRRLFGDFVGSFDGADALILAEIYGVTGREEGQGDVSSRDLARAVGERDRHEKRERPIAYAVDLPAALSALREGEQKGDVLLVMGAGDIYTIAEKLVG